MTCLRSTCLPILLAATAASAATDPSTAGPRTPGKTTFSIPVTQGATMPTDVHYPAAGAGVDPAACPCPVVVFGHGFQRSKERYVNLGRHLASRGFIMMAGNFPGGSDHARNAEDLRALLDWILARHGDPASIFHGRIAADRLATSGHSAGGLSALVAASRDVRVRTTAPLDPVDSGGLGVAAMPSIRVPVAITSSEPSSCNGNGSAATLYQAALPPRRGVKIVGATHCDPEDPTEFLCEAFCGSADAARQLLYKKYVTGWLELLLHCDASYEPWALGANAQADAAAGRITFDADMTPRPPTGATATGAGCAIDVSRTAPSQCAAISGWRVYRSTQSGTGHVQVAQLPVSALSFTDTGVAPGTTYYYVLRDYYGAAESANSAEVSAAATGAPPAAAFAGAPLTGPAPLAVSFSDASTGGVTSWSWSFGDGATSTQPSPTHVYTGAGAYDVALTVGSACGSDTETKPGYIVVTAGAAADAIVAGPGPGASNPNRARIFTVGGAMQQDWLAYGANAWGTNVAVAEIDGGFPEVVTGPGPGSGLGPQVRGFRRDAAPLPKVNFYAYGTLRYGVNVAAGRADADAFAEIESGGGPGAVFGPHVRGFDYDGTSVRAMGKLSFYAYGTLRFGVEVAAGDLDADGYAEVLTGPGPGPTFAPQVRAFDYDGSAVNPIARLNGTAFSTTSFGCRVAAGDVDGDGAADGVFGPGPGPATPAQIRGFRLVTGPMALLPGFDLTAFPSLAYGLRPGSAVLDGTPADALAGQGADPTAGSRLRGYAYAGAILTPVAGAEIDAYGGLTHGVAVAGGPLGY